MSKQRSHTDNVLTSYWRRHYMVRQSSCGQF